MNLFEEIIDRRRRSEGKHLLYLSISGSWTHHAGLISETFRWDVSQLVLRSEAVIVHWFRLGCSLKFWELLLQSADCNDGEPSMWQHWLHHALPPCMHDCVCECARVCVYLSSQVGYLFVLREPQIATASIRLCQCSYRAGVSITQSEITNLTVWFHPLFIHLLISVFNYKLDKDGVKTHPGVLLHFASKYIAHFLLAASELCN